MNWAYRHTALVLCTLAFGVTMVARLSISPVVPQITADFQVTNATVGLALSGMWAAYALCQFPSGVLGDRFGERRVILAAVGLTGVSTLLLAVVPSFPLFALAVVLLGAAAGLHYTVATTYLASLFDNIGRAIGFHVAGGPIAGLLTPVAVAAVAAQYGWRAAMLLGTVLAIPIYLLFRSLIRPTPPNRPDQPMAERFELGAIRELLVRPPIIYTTLLAMLGAFTWQATASFLPVMLQAHHGLSTATASLLFSIYFLSHGLTQPVTGWLSDRFSRDGATMLTTATGVVAYGLLVVDGRLWALVVGSLGAGLAMSWGSPLQSRFLDRLSAAEQGAGFGLVRTVYMILGASGSLVVGAVSDLAGWPVAFGLLSTIMALSLCGLLANRLLGLGL